MHPRDAAAGDSLRLRVEVIQADRTLTVQEYEFVYARDAIGAS